MGALLNQILAGMIPTPPPAQSSRRAQIDSKGKAASQGHLRRIPACPKGEGGFCKHAMQKMDRGRGQRAAMASEGKDQHPKWQPARWLRCVALASWIHAGAEYPCEQPARRMAQR